MATEQFHFHYGADQLISTPEKQFRGWRRNDRTRASEHVDQGFRSP